MNWNTVDLNLLTVFDVVVQEKNLTRAGQRLGLSQSAVSHALARLRHMLGDELFVRTPDGMQPTPRAERIAAPIHDALHEIRATLESDEFNAADATRSFTITANNYAARAVVPPLVRRVIRLAPRVEIVVRPTGQIPILDQLDRGTADLALATLTDGGERFKCSALLDDEYAVLLPKDLQAETETILSVNQLASLPHIAITSSGDDTDFIDRGLAELGLSRHVAVKVPLHSLASVMVGSGAVAVLPRRVAADIATFQPLTLLSLPFASPRVSLSMLWHRRLDHDLGHQWLRAQLRACIAEA